MVKLKILNIVQDSIVDGVGMRAVIFFSGCPHKCKGCHNPESWDINKGSIYTVDEVIEEINKNTLVKGVTFSGGEPFYQAENIIPLAKKLKLSGYNLWSYTGYLYEDLIKDKVNCNLLQYIDVLVDGLFIEDKKDLTLAFRGSSNQRIIDIQESLKEGVVIKCNQKQNTF